MRVQHVSVEVGLRDRRVPARVAREQRLRMGELVFLQLLLAIKPLAALTASRGEGEFSYSAKSSQDCLKRFTFYSLADLFNRTPSRLLWESSSHAAVNAPRLFVHKHPPLSRAMYSIIQLSELEQCRGKKTCPKFYTAA